VSSPLAETNLKRKKMSLKTHHKVAEGVQTSKKIKNCYPGYKLENIYLRRKGIIKMYTFSEIFGMPTKPLFF
jgi:hypothetical protein